MLQDEIRTKLYEMQDEGYRQFQSKLIPTIEIDRMIGVRTPELRKYAKELLKREDISVFLNALPHPFFDEDQLHAFLLSEMKHFDVCIGYVARFLPYVNNWATCDQLSPRIFRNHKEELWRRITEWLSSKETYTVRFAIGMLMRHFLEEDFDQKYPECIARIRSDEYYVNMMIAWYFATALAKQYHAALPFLEQRRLDPWTHHKTIQKAIESGRITEEQKHYLRSLKM